MPRGTRNPPGPLSREINAVIRSAIARRLGVKQGDVARAVGISASQFSSILTDQKHFDIDQLDKVCLELGLELHVVIYQASMATSSRHAEQSGPDLR